MWRSATVITGSPKNPQAAFQACQNMPVADQVHVAIASEDDVLTVRQQARSLAVDLGFWSVEQTFIAIAVSELALNILLYAGRGEIALRKGERRGASGIIVVARDEGPGIADIQLAMQDGYSTSGRAGLGLPGAKRLMDEFEILSERGKGTTVTMKKWVR
jgi:serine/threonine-protein kinase RsbT